MTNRKKAKSPSVRPTKAERAQIRTLMVEMLSQDSPPGRSSIFKFVRERFPHLKKISDAALTKYMKQAREEVRDYVDIDVLEESKRQAHILIDGQKQCIDEKDHTNVIGYSKQLSSLLGLNKPLEINVKKEVTGKIEHVKRLQLEMIISVADAIEESGKRYGMSQDQISGMVAEVKANIASKTQTIDVDSTSSDD